MRMARSASIACRARRVTGTIPSATSLVEEGVKVAFEPNGKLKNLADAAKVAPFQPWALALYKFRQQNNFVDDPMKVCIGPGNPRQMMTPGGVRFIQDNNYKRMYMIFGGGNHTWRTIYMDGRDSAQRRRSHRHLPRALPWASGKATRWWPHPRASTRASGCPMAACRTPKALTLTERFKRVSKDELDYEVTIDDPRTYTRPWKAGWTLRWVPGDIQEQFCETGRE